MDDAGVEGVARFPNSGSFLLFFEHYLLPNRPCVFGECFTEGWRAREEWRNDDDTPNITFLQETFGILHCIVQSLSFVAIQIVAL